MFFFLDYKRRERRGMLGYNVGGEGGIFGMYTRKEKDEGKGIKGVGGFSRVGRVAVMSEIVRGKKGLL